LLTPIATLALAYWLLSRATSWSCRLTRVAAWADIAMQAMARGVSAISCRECFLEWITLSISEWLDTRPTGWAASFRAFQRLAGTDA
jgi:hypothetical protein